jgi:hypothetical protein
LIDVPSSVVKRTAVFTVTDRRWTNCVLLVERYRCFFAHSNSKPKTKRSFGHKRTNVRTTKQKNDSTNLPASATFPKAARQGVVGAALVGASKKVSKSERAILPMTRAIFLRPFQLCPVFRTVLPSRERALKLTIWTHYGIIS